jgi:hypothetical protein
MLLSRGRIICPRNSVSDIEWGGEGGMYHCYIEMDGFVVQKPIREGALGTHHVGVFLRRHALLVLF